MSARILGVSVIVCLLIGVGCSKMVPVSQPFMEKIREGDRIRAAFGDGTILEADVGKIQGEVLTLAHWKWIEEGTNPPTPEFFSLPVRVGDIQKLEISQSDPIKTLITLIGVAIVLAVVVVVALRKAKTSQAGG